MSLICSPKARNVKQRKYERQYSTTTIETPDIHILTRQSNKIQTLPIRTKGNIVFPIQATKNITIGQLGENILMCSHQVMSMVKKKDTLTFYIQQKDLQYIELDQTFNILDLLQLNKAKNSIFRMVESFEKGKGCKLLDHTEIQLNQQIIQSQPFECFKGVKTNQGIQFVEYITNTSYLNLIGVTQSMLECCLKEKHTLPSGWNQDDFLKFLEDYICRMNVKQEKYVQEFKNYNGIRLFVQTHFRQMNYIDKKNEQEYVLMYWNYRVQPDQSDILKNQEDLIDIRKKRCLYKHIVSE